MFSLVDHKDAPNILNWAKSKNGHDTFSWIEQRRLKWIKQRAKTCHFCDKPIRFWHLTAGCCGSFDYVRAHRKCAKMKLGE